MDRKNIHRGFKKLRVWQDAIALYALAYKIVSKFPFELKKVAANSIDAAHSISRNIPDGLGQIPNCSYMTMKVYTFIGDWIPLQQLFVKAGKDATIAAALLRPG